MDRMFFVGVLLLFVNTALFAQFEGGSGTEVDPYQVETATQLDSVRWHLSDNFIQTAEIDLDIAPYNVGEGWVPIGNDLNSFTGNYNGQFYSINDLYINRLSDSQGLFGIINDCAIDSVVISNAVVTGLNCVGILFGESGQNVIIERCSVDGSVTGTSNIGGLTGELGRDNTLNECRTDCYVTGDNSVGGLAGSTIEDCVISNCSSKGSVTGDNSVGGLNGFFQDSDMSNCYSTSLVSGTNDTGGLIGENKGIVINSYWDIQTSDQSTSGGGEGKTTAEMMVQSTYMNWDFTTPVWVIDPDLNEGYPYLDWQKLIIISSPNGSENWAQDKQYEISWTDYIDGKVRIELFQNDAYFSTIIDSTENDGSYLWTVPTNISGSNFQIKISSVAIPDVVNDFSDAYFTIPQGIITILIPNGGESLTRGNQYEITWTDDIVEEVKLELYENNAFHSTIIDSTESDGSYLWTVPIGISGSNFQIKIASEVIDIVNDISDTYFTIPQGVITISTPNEGESLTRGNQYEITWTDDITEEVSIELLQNDAYFSTIIDSTESDGSYLWTVQNDLFGLDFKILITSVGYPVVKDQSDNHFEILDYFSDINAVFTGVDNGSSAWGDYDNDGDLDILLTGYTGEIRISRIYRNDSGIFTDIGAGLIGVYYSSAAWGDYDNDGDLDILLTGDTGSGYISKIYSNNSGVFADINAGLTGVYHSSVAWGDYDNDGDLDILLTGIYEGRVSKIYRNDSGVFTDINADLTGVRNSSVAWGDYDNDGDLDILLTGNIGSGYTSKIYSNDLGVFTDIGAGLIGVDYSSVAWGDYDNDSDLDILLTGNTGSGYTSKIYSNDLGEFTDIGAGLIGVYYSSVAWGDYDNDGDLDILLTGDTGLGYISKIYSNDLGEFTDISAGLTEVRTSSVAWGDYDNDGDLDILLTGINYDGSSHHISKIYRNNSMIGNTVPNSPLNLELTLNQNKLNFSFDPAEDSETLSVGLTYNIDIKNENGIVKTASSDLSTGYKRLSSMGNIQQNTSWTLEIEAIPQQLFDMTWKVQAVDNCFAGSMFSSRNDSLMNRNLITIPKEIMIASDELIWEYINPFDSIASYTLQVSDDSLFADCFETSFSAKKDNKTAYFGIDLQSLGILDSLENNWKYYWRVKPEHVNPAIATGFKSVPDSFIYNPTYYPPSPVNIEVSGGLVTISWNIEKSVDKGEVYNVYSTNDPSAAFPTGWNYEATVNGTEWLTIVSELKRFYCVTATGNK